MKVLAILLVLFYFNAKGQTDTIVEGISFNYISYYERGQIFELGNINSKNSQFIKHGYWVICDDNGNLIEKGSYKKNKKTGIWKERGSDNKCCWTGVYKNGKKHGKWFNGINKYEIYKRGKLKGEQYVNFL